jgi:hypothetical protein
MAAQPREPPGRNLPIFEVVCTQQQTLKSRKNHEAALNGTPHQFIQGEIIGRYFSMSSCPRRFSILFQAQHSLVSTSISKSSTQFRSEATLQCAAELLVGYAHITKQVTWLMRASEGNTFSKKTKRKKREDALGRCFCILERTSVLRSEPSDLSKTCTASGNEIKLLKTSRTCVSGFQSGYGSILLRYISKKKKKKKKKMVILCVSFARGWTLQKVT